MFDSQVLFDKVLLTSMEFAAFVAAVASAQLRLLVSHGLIATSCLSKWRSVSSWSCD